MLLEAGRVNTFKVVERPVARMELERASGCFLTNSASLALALAARAVILSRAD